MDDAKPDTVTVEEAQLREERRGGTDKCASQLRAAMTRGVTAAVRQPDGGVIYFSDTAAFEAWLAALP
jgi:hypothetical protein